MNVRALIAGLLVSSLAAADAKPPKITSKSTGLYPSKTCKTKIAGAEGQDPVLRCPALKGFEVEVSFSAIDTHVTITGGSQAITFRGLVGPTLEWRLVGGKPFALLVELGLNDTDEDGNPINRNPHIEVIELAGPRQQVPIIGVKPKGKKDAWAKARALADATQRPAPATPK